jgi:hypothetical protein
MAVSAQKRKSHAHAHERPAPAHAPLTAAMVGLSISRSESEEPMPVRSVRTAAAVVGGMASPGRPLKPLDAPSSALARLPPTQNARVPLPVSTITRTLLSSAARSSASCTPMFILRPMELSLCGALSVITATPSDRASYCTSLSKTEAGNAAAIYNC